MAEHLPLEETQGRRGHGAGAAVGGQRELAALAALPLTNDGGHQIVPYPGEHRIFDLTKTSCLILWLHFAYCLLYERQKLGQALTLRHPQGENRNGNTSFAFSVISILLCLPVAAIGKFSLVGRSSYGADDEGMTSEETGRKENLIARAYSVDYLMFSMMEAVTSFRTHDLSVVHLLTFALNNTV
uniref:Uncharacterized protein n=1 Tax=Oryza barthii TaxID=65489 RepID=A0A0D3GCS9_9ORYZ